MRRTRQPRCLSVLPTRTSRTRLADSFFFQKARLFTGSLKCFGHECQKQPSTNTARRSLGKTKSGLPNTDCRRRQPVMRCARNNRIKASSVSLESRSFCTWAEVMPVFVRDRAVEMHRYWDNILLYRDGILKVAFSVDELLQTRL